MKNDRILGYLGGLLPQTQDGGDVNRASRRLIMVAFVLASFLTAVSLVAVAAEETMSVEVSPDAVDASAVNPAFGASAVVEAITEDLISLIESAQTYVDEDEPRFYSELGDTLQKYVDFESFSRAVMGRYAGRKAMADMDDAQRAKLQGQIDRFNDVFSGALIDTYGKGLLVFEGERIEVVAPSPEAAEKARAGKAMVKQLIYGEREKPFEIYYSLRKVDDGDWKIRNMIVEASNLGKIYRNQFANAYKVYEGDIDKVIDNWVVSGD